MASGVKCDPMVREVYDTLYKTKTRKFCVFMMSPTLDKIMPDWTLMNGIDPKCTYKELIEHEQFPKHEPRYIIYDVEYKLKDGGERRKILFVAWSPDDGAKLKHKMVYASSKSNLKKDLEGIVDDFQVNEFDDLLSFEEGYIDDMIAKGK